MSGKKVHIKCTFNPHFLVFFWLKKQKLEKKAKIRKSKIIQQEIPKGKVINV